MKPYSIDNVDAATARMQTASYVPYKMEHNYYDKVYDGTLSETTLKYKQAKERWTDMHDAELTLMYSDYITLMDIASYFERTVEQVEVRLKELGL